MCEVVETGVPSVGEIVVESRPEPIGLVSGVFMHRAIPFGSDAVMNLLTDITRQRRPERELERGRDERNERLVELLRRTDARAKRLIDGILEYARHGTAVEFETVDTAAASFRT
jgi:hypothetical protein